MSGKKSTGSNIEQPSVEVIVRTGDEELAVIAFFSDGTGGYDVVVGVSDTKARDSLKAILHSAADSMGAAAFRPTRATANEGMDDSPPF